MRCRGVRVTVLQSQKKQKGLTLVVVLYCRALAGAHRSQAGVCGHLIGFFSEKATAAF